MGGRPTRDAALARDVFDHLAGRHLRVFLSSITLEREGVSSYKKAIDQALDRAQVLVAVGTSAAHLDSEWVRQVIQHGPGSLELLGNFVANPLGAPASTPPTPPPARIVPQPPVVAATKAGDWEEKARAMLEQGEKIGAIKLVRESTALDLKSAKDLVESWHVVAELALSDGREFAAPGSSRPGNCCSAATRSKLSSSYEKPPGSG